jgi:hypothetical protein
MYNLYYYGTSKKRNDAEELPERPTAQTAADVLEARQALQRRLDAWQASIGDVVPHLDKQYQAARLQSISQWSQSRSTNDG